RLLILLLGQPWERIAVHFSCEVVFRWSRRTAVEAYPRAKQRVGEAVAFLARDDQVDVFQPRQVVFRRSGRSLEALGDLRQRQSFVLAENLEDRLERAVSARAMQAQLVGEVTQPLQPAFGAHERGQGANRIAGRGPTVALFAHAGEFFSDRPHVGWPS